ncbi:potassium voltage-gated channel protein Shab-like [Centruroides vittatus]|uniref:potassium voltage-gated channel protein Shab-like n=1 Tax=Centruroides vittatus TaxID=120091 RepID=UPI0035107B39
MMDLISIIPYLIANVFLRIVNFRLWIDENLVPVLFLTFFRMPRIFRFGRYFSNVENIILTYARSLPQIISLLVLIITILLFICQSSSFIETDFWTIFFLSENPKYPIPKTAWGKAIWIARAVIGCLLIGIPLSVVSRISLIVVQRARFLNILEKEYANRRIAKERERFQSAEMASCVSNLLGIVIRHLFLEIESEAEEELGTWRYDSVDFRDQTEIKRSARVVLMVGGSRFETKWESLKTLPNSRLGRAGHSQTVNQLLRYCNRYHLEENKIIFDRHPRFFDSILNLYQTGKFHVDKVCIAGLSEELVFWGIEEMRLEPCCQMRYFFLKKQSEDFFALKEKLLTDADWSSNNELLRVKMLMQNPKFLWIFKLYGIITCSLSLLDIFLLIFVSKKNYHLLGIKRTLSIIFFLEYFLKLCVCSDKRQFLLSFINTIELLAVGPSFLVYGSRPFSSKIQHPRLTIWDCLTVLRVIKLIKYYGSQKILAAVLFAQDIGMAFYLFALLAMCIFFSTLISIIETKGSLVTVNVTLFDTFCFAVTALTNVGGEYFAPETHAGKLVAGFCCVTGTILLTLPISCIVAEFVNRYDTSFDEFEIIKSQISKEKKFSTTTVKIDSSMTETINSSEA